MVKSLIKKTLLHYGFEIKKIATVSEEYPHKHVPVSVKEALALMQSEITEPKEDEALAKRIMCVEETAKAPSSREIFSSGNAFLACWQDSDLGLYDDWLTAANYYPMYYALFQKLTSYRSKTRLLEIGVRTGYLGAVFAKASKSEAFYMGVDPNEYVANGLQLASETFKILRSQLKTFDFVLIEGYSNDIDVQKSLIYSGAFDIIHIDGDHTITGKLIDLELARHLISDDGIVLVDDYDYHASVVSEPTKRALALGWFKKFAYLPTKRGLAVLQR